MDIYQGKLQLAGNVMNEVFKMNMTAAEIEVLRAIHGADAVVDIKKMGSDKRTSAQERDRLNRLYANPDANTTKSLKKKVDMMRGLFGHDRLPLPETMDDLQPLEDSAPIEDAPAPAPKAKPQRAAAFAD